MTAPIPDKVYLFSLSRIECLRDPASRRRLGIPKYQSNPAVTIIIVPLRDVGGPLKCDLKKAMNTPVDTNANIKDASFFFLIKRFHNTK